MCVKAESPHFSFCRHAKAIVHALEECHFIRLVCLGLRKLSLIFIFGSDSWDLVACFNQPEQTATIRWTVAP